MEAKGLVVALMVEAIGVLTVPIMVVVLRAGALLVVVVIILLGELVAVVERTVFVLIANCLGIRLIIVMISILSYEVYMLLLIPSLGLLHLDPLLDKV